MWPFLLPWTCVNWNELSSHSLFSISVPYIKLPQRLELPWNLLFSIFFYDLETDQANFCRIRYSSTVMSYTYSFYINQTYVQLSLIVSIHHLARKPKGQEKSCVAGSLEVLLKKTIFILTWFIAFCTKYVWFTIAYSSLSARQIKRALRITFTV